MKTKNIFLIIVLFSSSFAFSQTKIKVPDNGKNVLFNEFWSRSTGNPASVFFYQYFFADDGTFLCTYGYSGGMYYKTDCKGQYQYNPLKKEIRLLNSKCDKKGLSLAKQTPTTISIKEMTDNKVTFYDEKNKSEEVMSRLVGMTTDQYWYKGPNSSQNSIHFDIFGQAVIVQESDIRREYGCTYNIVGNYLFLEVRGVTTGEKSNERKTQLFTPEIKTYLKIKIEKDSVRLENIDLYKIMDGKRNWAFKNMEYLIEKSVDNKTEYDKYTRVVGGY